MTREEKCELAIKKGFTYDKVTGKIYGVRGKEVPPTGEGYVSIKFKYLNKPYHIFAHQFIYYITYGHIPNMIDHINRIKDDNRVENLRPTDNQRNQLNCDRVDRAKGYTIDKNKVKKYRSIIRVNHKSIYLGNYYTPEEARQAYLDAKKRYHII